MRISKSNYLLAFMFFWFSQVIEGSKESSTNPIGQSLTNPIGHLMIGKKARDFEELFASINKGREMRNQGIMNSPSAVHDASDGSGSPSAVPGSNNPSSDAQAEVNSEKGYENLQEWVIRLFDLAMDSSGHTDRGEIIRAVVDIYGANWAQYVHKYDIDPNGKEDYTPCKHAPWTKEENEEFWKGPFGIRKAVFHLLDDLGGSYAVRCLKGAVNTVYPAAADTPGNEWKKLRDLAQILSELSGLSRE